MEWHGIAEGITLFFADEEYDAGLVLVLPGIAAAAFIVVGISVFRLPVEVVLVNQVVVILG